LWGGLGSQGLFCGVDLCPGLYRAIAVACGHPRTLVPFLSQEKEEQGRKNTEGGVKNRKNRERRNPLFLFLPSSFLLFLTPCLRTFFLPPSLVRVPYRDRIHPKVGQYRT
jgi:hypothetical protein